MTADFTDASTLVCPPKTMDSRSVVMADLWNRGVLDVVVANQNGAPMIYKNSMVERPHWVDFELIGHVSNRDAIGAIVMLYSDDLSQAQVITGGIGFSSQNQHRVHFGLGDKEQIDRIEIMWPSGEIQVIDNPSIDQLHVVEENKGII